MFEEISDIQSRIADIQQRLAALSPPAGSAPAPGAPSFGQALTQAQNAGAPPPMPLPERAEGFLAPPAGGARSEVTSINGQSIRVPAASLGPLPALPIAPSSVVPLAPGASGDALPHLEGRGTGPYDDLIQNYAGRHGLPPELVKAVIQTESGGNPKAVSRAGAMGLMQLMPANVQEAGIHDPFDPEQNIAAGTKQLAGLMAQYHGDLDLTLAGYNAGPGNVRKYGGVPPFAETQQYIRKVRAAMERG